MLPKNIFNLISDIRFSIIGIFIFAFVIAIATFVEKYFGTDYVLKAIYHNSAIYILLALITLSYISIVIKRGLFKLNRLGGICIHSAFAIIVMGAITTHLCSSEGILHVREGETSSCIILKDGGLLNRPYSVRLDKFEIEYYEGSEFPSAYKSFVTIDNGNGVFDTVVEVNKVLKVGRDRIYQSSYDDDKKGVTLLVNTDFAGYIITYTGYTLLLLGFILSLFGKNSRFRDILNKLSAKTAGKSAIMVLLLLFSGTISAKGIDFNESDLIPKADGEKWERIYILGNNEMIEPLECHARTILRKLTKKNGDSKGWGARLYMSIVAYPEKWSNVPLFYCNNNEIYDLLGLKRDKYISYNSLFDSDGSYKLLSLNSNNSNIVKEIYKLDEKSKIFSALANGLLLKIFPTEGNRWVANSETAFYGKDSIFVSSIFSEYVNALKSGNSNSLDFIDHISSFQKLKSKKLIPSSTKTNLSIFYSKAPIFKITALGYLILGIILSFLAIKYLKGASFMQQIGVGAVTGAIFAMFLLHTSGILLRWYISEQPPWSNTYETMLYVAWCMCCGGFIFIKRFPVVCGLATVMSAVTLLIASLNWLDPVITPLMPVLNSPWLILHVTVITASYGFFGICAILGVCAILLSFRNSSDSIVKQLSLINEFLMYIGLSLVTIGTFLGAIWANLSWGRYWGWDAKESWALVTIVVYAIVTHIRLVPKWRNDIIFSTLSVFALLSVLMTYFGVNYYLSGLHSYGNSENPPAIGAVAVIYVAVTILSIIAYIKQKRDRAR